MIAPRRLWGSEVRNSTVGSWLWVWRVVETGRLGRNLELLLHSSDDTQKKILSSRCVRVTRPWRYRLYVPIYEHHAVHMRCVTSKDDAPPTNAIHRRNTSRITNQPTAPNERPRRGSVAGFLLASCFVSSHNFFVSSFGFYLARGFLVLVLCSIRLESKST